MAGTKLTHTEVNERIEKCFHLRYKENYKQKQWIAYCIKEYGDKSEKQYHQYWAKAKEDYDGGWRERLNKQLDPAVNTLIGLLASDDEKIRQRAVDQVMKFNGEDEIKVAISGQMEIKLNWGDIEESTTDI